MYERMLNKDFVPSFRNDRYPCGNTGGWIHYRILNEDELKDVLSLIEIRKKSLKIL